MDQTSSAAGSTLGKILAPEKDREILRRQSAVKIFPSSSLVSRLKNFGREAI